MYLLDGDRLVGVICVIVVWVFSVGLGRGIRAGREEDAGRCLPNAAPLRSVDPHRDILLL